MRTGIAHGHCVHLARWGRAHVENVDVRLSSIVEPHLALVWRERDAVTWGRRRFERDRSDHMPVCNGSQLEAVVSNDVVYHKGAATVDGEGGEHASAAVPGDGGHHPVGFRTGDVDGLRGGLRLH